MSILILLLILTLILMLMLLMMFILNQYLQEFMNDWNMPKNPKLLYTTSKLYYSNKRKMMLFFYFSCQAYAWYGQGKSDQKCWKISETINKSLKTTNYELYPKSRFGWESVECMKIWWDTKEESLTTQLLRICTKEI